MEAPHTIFISVPDTIVIKELFFEELSDDELSEQSTDMVQNTAAEEEADLEAESLCVSPSSNVVIKDELIIEEQQRGQHTDMRFPSAVSVPVKEEVIVEELHYKNSALVPEHSLSNTSHVSSVIELSTQHKMDQNKVTKCQCKVRWLNGVSQYTSIHSGAEKFKCPVHGLINSGIKRFHCDVCNQVFTMPYRLERHKLTHRDVKKYPCDMCNKSFTQLYGLAKHKSAHGVQYRCDVCGKAYYRLYQLAAHKVIHSGIKMYQCDVCNKAFAQPRYLTQHKIVHSGTKKHQCDVCNKAFLRAGDLSKHKATHRRTKRF